MPTAQETVETTMGPERVSSVEQCERVGIDPDVINEAVHVTLDYAVQTKGPMALAVLESDPGLAIMVGVTLAATYLHLND